MIYYGYTMILLDYNAIAISNVIAQGLENDDDLIRHMILNSIRMYRTKYKKKYGEIVICTDGKKNWRKEYFPQYKYKRKAARDDSKRDWNALYEITESVLDDLRNYFPYKVVGSDHCEADDVIATLVSQTQDFGNYEENMIISSDKDFVQLQCYNNVEQYSPIRKKHLKEPSPLAFLMEHVLKGDAGDGIPNVLSDDNVFVDGRRQTILTAKRKEGLFSNGKLTSEDPEILNNIKRNMKLIDLNMTPQGIKTEIINNFNDTDMECRGDRSKVMKYLMMHRCRLLLECIEEFVND